MGLNSCEAHEWFPQDCCHEQDCYKTKLGDEITILEDGYWVDSKLIPFSDPKIRLGNPTNDFFICRSGKVRQNTAKCIFPPGPGT